MSEDTGKIPEQGFIKLTAPGMVFQKKEEKVALIRKGNLFYNEKKYDLAKRIFITTGYTDGLIRLGDYYMEQKNPMEAFRMYWLAPSKKNVEQMIEKMAGLIKYWLQEQKKGK